MITANMARSFDIHLKLAIVTGMTNHDQKKFEIYPSDVQIAIDIIFSYLNHFYKLWVLINKLYWGWEGGI